VEANNYDWLRTAPPTPPPTTQATSFDWLKDDAPSQPVAQKPSADFSWLQDVPAVQRVQTQPRKSNVDDYLVKHESGGDYFAQNPSSSAFGKYQVIDSTRRGVAKKLGISDNYAKTPEGQEQVYSELKRQYSSNLSRWGQEETPANMYTVHQLGAGRAKRFFSGKLTSKDVGIMYKNLRKSDRGKIDRFDREAVLSAWEQTYRHA